jgi:uncharacterized protein
VPYLSHFPELNVRTYVLAEGKPGVWFFSLDAANPIAVRAARAAFYLPYFDAKMSCLVEAERVFYQSQRSHRGAARASFVAHYKPLATLPQSQPGTLEYFLTERYCLYSADGQGHIYRGEIHHKPWPLQEAEAELRLNTMAEQIGLKLPDTQPLLHFAKALEVLAWLPERSKS